MKHRVENGTRQAEPIIRTLALLVISACAAVGQIEVEDFDDIKLYSLRNAGGTEVKITNYGATITSISVKDRAGEFEDVALGYDRLEDYMNAVDKPYFGSVVGRYGNRIAKGALRCDARLLRTGEIGGVNGEGGSI